MNTGYGHYDMSMAFDQDILKPLSSSERHCLASLVTDTLVTLPTAQGALDTGLRRRFARMATRLLSMETPEVEG